jgi:hypothetical protein
VAAATDLQLAATPAFGKQRPDVSFLLWELNRVWQKVADRPQLALAVLQPVISAAGQLLSHHGISGAAGADASLQAAAQLLDAVCSLLASNSSGSQQRLSYAGVQQPVMQGVLAVLQQHPELPTLQHLQAAVCAAVRAEVTAGSGSIMEAAEQLAASGQQLSMAELNWLAVEGAATAFLQQTAAPDTRISPELLVAYWSTAVLSAADAAPSSSAVSAVVAAMAADTAAGGGLTQQLLAAQQPLPAAVLGALLQAAQSNDVGRTVLPLLLQHALRNEQAPLLPEAVLLQLLQSALAAVAAAAAEVSFADCMQLLDLVLQQWQQQQQQQEQQRRRGVAASVSAETATTAQSLLHATESSAANRQQFEALLQKHGKSPAVSVLLCSMLQSACKGDDTERSWQLFQLLQQSCQPSQQQLQACSVLLVQQRGNKAAACTATAGDRIMFIWQHCSAAAGSSGAAIKQLSTTAQRVMVSALVADGQSKQTLLLAHQVPALLPHLAAIWEQQVQQEGSSVDTAALLQALQMCVAAGGKHAAEAVDTLARLLLQQDASGAWRDGELPMQLLQLLCTHGKAATALQLLPGCLARVGSEGAAVAAIAAATGAVAQGGDTHQQAELLQLLATGAKQAGVQVALSQALEQPAPAALGLLLRALRDSSPEQGLGQLLTPNQLKQLCKMVCSSSQDNSGSSSSTTLTALPSVQQFAVDCLSATQLPDGVAAQLLDVLCRQHPELQPSAAAQHMGVDAAHARSSTIKQGRATAVEGQTANFEQLVQVVAELCYSQIGSSCSLPTDVDDLEASFAEWASAQSLETAAAALVAISVHRGQRWAGPAVPLLCLELYQRVKPTGDSLVFDLGLLAAAEAAQHTCNWRRGRRLVWCPMEHVIPVPAECCTANQSICAQPLP